jgi:hypothetical protein
LNDDGTQAMLLITPPAFTLLARIATPYPDVDAPLLAMTCVFVTPVVRATANSVTLLVAVESGADRARR